MQGPTFRDLFEEDQIDIILKTLESKKKELLRRLKNQSHESQAKEMARVEKIEYDIEKVQNIINTIIDESL